MYRIGDLIVYSGEGVCRVEDIGTPNSSGAQSARIYYTLAPLYRTGLVYTPVDGNVFMRPVISREEAIALIRQIPDTEAAACEERNLRFLTEHYQSCLQRHDCLETVKLIKSIGQKRQNAASRGKKLGQIDERYRKRAEDLLYGELAVALDIPREEIAAYIAEAVDKLAAGELWEE